MSVRSRPDGAISSAPSQPATARLVRWSWVMVGLLLASYLVAFVVGTLLMHALDVPEGELLTTAGALGWLAALLVLAIGVAPLVAGVVLAGRAHRRGVGRSALLPMVVNGLLLAWLVLSTVLQLVLVSVLG